jgi:hypothetical protein
MAKTVAGQFAEDLAAAGVKRIHAVVGDSLNGLTDALRRQGGFSPAREGRGGAEAHLTGEFAVCAGSCGPLSIAMERPLSPFMFPTWFRARSRRSCQSCTDSPALRWPWARSCWPGGCLPCLPDRCDARLHRLAAWLRPAGGRAGWLILKSEGALQDWAWKRIPWLAGAALAVVCVAFIIALGDRDRISGALHERTWGLVFPLLASWRYTSSS